MLPSGFFHHCPACGVARAGTAPTGPFVCAGCGFTFYFNAATATAVFVRRAADGRMLFVKRARDPGKGLLAPPGGFVDIGERVEDALRREIREEVGLEIGPPRFLASFPNSYLYRDVTYPVLDLFFTADACDPDRAAALDDVEALVWLDPVGELDPAQLAFPSMRSALEVLRGILTGSGRGGQAGEGVPGGWTK